MCEMKGLAQLGGIPWLCASSARLCILTEDESLDFANVEIRVGSCLMVLPDPCL